MSRPHARPDGSFVVAGDGLPAGSTLGGPDLCVVLAASGAIAEVRSLRAGASLVNGLLVRCWDLDTGLRLSEDGGMTELQPESQTRRFANAGLRVEQTVFAGLAREVPACYLVVRLRNDGPRRRRIASLAVARIGERLTGEQLEVRYDAAQHALLVRERGASVNPRAVSVDARPRSWGVTCDHARIVDDRWRGPLDGTLATGGSDPLGILHLEHAVRPGDEIAFALTVTALPGDGADGGAALRRSVPAGEAQHAVRAR